MSAHRVVIVGGGFGGLQAAHQLRLPALESRSIDRRNFHLFQPLYQVATGALSPGKIASPLRAVFKRRNVSVLLGEVAASTSSGAGVLRSDGDRAPEQVPYDTLIVAAGAHYSYFGHDEWSVQRRVKTLESALTSAAACCPRSRPPSSSTTPSAAARADFRGGRRRSHRRRDGRPDRGDRERHAEQRLPRRDSSAAGSSSSRAPTCAHGSSQLSASAARELAARRDAVLAAPSSTSTRRGHARAARRARAHDARTVVWAAGVPRRAPSALAEPTGAGWTGRPCDGRRRTSPSPAFRRSSRSATWPRPRRDGKPFSSRRRAGRDAAGALRGDVIGARLQAAPRRRSVTATRATWRRSGARGRGGPRA